MFISIKLNDMNYRYDVYHMFNVFYSLTEIRFVEYECDFEVNIEEDSMYMKSSKLFKRYEINGSEPKREQIRRYMFIYLTLITKKDMPWGTLIGIRPTKIAQDLISEGYKRDEVLSYYKSKYLASEEKANLCYDVAKFDFSVIKADNKNIGIYIDMPFCPTRCLYCSFASSPVKKSRKFIPLYVMAIEHEINEVSKYIKRKGLNIESIYFGGGTPTSIDDENFESILRTVYENFIDKHNIKEFTIECGRPDSLSSEKFRIMKTYGVTRISINPQTMNDKTLKVIGRTHSSSDVIEKFNEARKFGFDNINMDIIVGLPGEGLEEMRHTSDAIYDLSPENITIHDLCIKRGSRLHEGLVLNKKFEVQTQEVLNSMFLEVNRLSKRLDMHPYYMYRQKNMLSNMENTGYSKNGFESIYNVQMIEDKQTIIGFGADAVTKAVFLNENRIERFSNVKDAKGYVDRIDEMIKNKINLLDTLYGE